MTRSAAAAVVLACLVTSGQARSGPENGDAAESARDSVVVVRPQKQNIKQRIQLAGSLEPYEHARLNAKVTGYLEEILVDIGDRVAQGDVLARLSVPEMVAELRRAQAEVPAARARLQKARAEADLARLTHRRLAELRRSEPGAVAEQDVDVAAAEKKRAAAEIDLKRAEVQAAEARVAELETLESYATIRAPFDGVVIARFADTGALVSAGRASGPIVEVVRSDRLRLAIDIPENLVPLCRAGLRLDYRVDALPGRPFEAKISRLAGALNPETRSMRVEADVDNSSGELHPGMYARVSIDLAEIEGAIVLPATTLRSARGSSYVYAVQQGRVRRIDVKILKDDGAQVVVEGEIGPDTRVILPGPALLEEGQPVRALFNGDGR